MIHLTKREREEILWATGGFCLDQRIGAGLARKGLAKRNSYYEPEWLGGGRGGTVIEYDLTDEGILLRDKLWAEESGREAT
jgi:hypothetical protein